MALVMTSGAFELAFKEANHFASIVFALFASGKSKRQTSFSGTKPKMMLA